VWIDVTQGAELSKKLKTITNPVLPHYVNILILFSETIPPKSIFPIPGEFGDEPK